MNGTLAAVVAALALALVAIGVLTGGEEASEPAEPGGAGVEQVRKRVSRVAREVERIRGLRFERVPEIEFLTPAQSREFARREIDRAATPAEVAAGEETLKLLGLLEPRDDLRKILTEAIGDETAGFYAPRSDRLVLVRGSVSGSFETDLVLAHELVHALEDQHFGLDSEDDAKSLSDPVVARSALHEGTATVVMVDWMVRRFGAEGRRSRLLREISKLAGSGIGGDLPPYIGRLLVFPYAAGAPFVDRAVRRGGWRAANRMLDGHPPSSTEQVIHGVSDRPARPPAPAAPPGAGWRRVERDTLGEFDTAELLRVAVDRHTAERAAAGWGSGRYALWRLGSLDDPDCPPPCRRRDVLVAGWRTDTAADASELERALGAYLTRGLRARRGGSAWVLEGGAAALARRGRAVALTMAPTPRLAERLAGATARR